MDIKNSKSILAKLLATEDVTVVHQKTQTASFDTKRRILTLPVWKDMTGNIYDLLVGHEVGHALETPAQGWHDAIERTQSRAFAGFLNVVEDARIEKKIKARFPGLRPSFYAAYQELLDRDFFGLQNNPTPMNEMLLIDRLNLHFKVGARLQVEFTEEEIPYVRRMHDLETWDDTETLARELFAYCRQELEEKKQQQKLDMKVMSLGDDSDSDDSESERLEFDLDLDQETMDEVDADPSSETDEAFRGQEKQLLDASCLPYHTFTFAKYDSTRYVVPWKKTLQSMVFLDEQEAMRTRVVNEFNKKNSQYVSMLVQQFERRRRAAELVRSRVGKSGELDMKKIFNYQLTEDVFRRFTVLPQGKNHGLIMVIDMSGSMQENFGNTLEQTLILVQFCRKLNIPFEVYGFSNSTFSREEIGKYDYEEYVKQIQTYQENDLVITDNFFSMRQYLTDAMPAAAFKRQFSNMVMLLNAYGTKGALSRYRSPDEFARHVPDANLLNGTPLNESIMLLPDLHRRFKERTGADIINLVVLTDGESDDRLAVRTSNQYRSYGGIPETARNNVILVDSVTKKSVQLQSHDRRGTKGLIRLVGAITGCRVLGFHIMLGTGSSAVRQALFQYQDYDHIQEQLNKKMQELRKNDVIVSTDQGYDEHYVIRGGTALQVQTGEFEVEDSTNIRQIQKAFIKARSNKSGSRVLLNRFIEMIA